MVSHVCMMMSDNDGEVSFMQECCNKVILGVEGNKVTYLLDKLRVLVPPTPSMPNSQKFATKQEKRNCFIIAGPFLFLG